MKDINNPLTKAYYDAISALGYPTFEGVEPDDTLDKMYIVINNVTSSDVSTKSSNDHEAQIQITVNSWEYKYNNRKQLNTVCGEIIEAVKPTPQSTLAATGVNIISTTLANDNETDYGVLAGRAYVSRNLIFSHLISY
ncbi:MAG TPA: hypothetical protein PLZ45_06730 [Ferruginibacter sp.]|nr:hypothetical protein [Ferruginibacter sp.]